jgi:Na+-translocating ferredoxin:NAD+ oxidoreductase RnfC subunit
VAAVNIPLKQHVGVECGPRVRVGDRVKMGDLIGDVPDGKVGAPVHASISGVVSSVDAEGIGIRA